MNILICNSTDSGGGAAKASYRLHQGLLENRMNSQFLTMNKQRVDSTVLNVFDYQVSRNLIQTLIHTLNYKVRNRLRKRKWAEYPNRQQNVSVSDITFSHLGNSLEEIDQDLLHLHWVENEFVNFKDLQGYSKPVVWTFHGCFPFTGICHFFTCEDEYYQTECRNCPILNSEKTEDLSTEMFHLKKERYDGLDIHVVCPSRWLADCARKSALMGHRPIHVIPNGIDTKLYSPIEKEAAKSLLGFHPDKKTVLFGAISATADPRKGYDYLKDAIKLLEQRYNHDEIEIAIFGSSGEGNRTVEGFKRRFLGFISDERLLAAVYSAADAMIVPSTHENLPCTIMESLACGTPVTAFDIGGNGEMIDHQKNGYLAEPLQAEDLAEGIRWCLENNVNNTLGQNGRQKVLDEYDYRDIAKKHIELYKTLI